MDIIKHDIHCHIPRDVETSACFESILPESFLSLIKQCYAMERKALSIRPFIGAKDFEISRSFYRDLGFEETVISHNLSVFETDTIGFYLQDYHVNDWIDNTMLFLEVADTVKYREELLALNLSARYAGVRLSDIREEPWGKECFLHDPSGILWHIGEFYN